MNSKESFPLTPKSGMLIPWVVSRLLIVNFIFSPFFTVIVPGLKLNLLASILISLTTSGAIVSS